MIIVNKSLTADNTDVLSGTDLANIPRAGQLDVFAASTQADTVMTVTGPGAEPIVRLQTLQLRANGIPAMDTDIPYSIPVTQGGKFIINVDVVTAATVNVVAIFRDLEDLGLE